MKKDLTIGELNDIYGKLLTEKQREMVRSYYDYDLSLSEIAENAGVSRQAVHDALVKADRELRAYEDALGIKRKRDEAAALLAGLKAALCGGDGERAQEIVARMESALRE